MTLVFFSYTVFWCSHPKPHHQFLFFHQGASPPQLCQQDRPESNPALQNICLSFFPEEGTGFFHRIFPGTLCLLDMKVAQSQECRCWAPTSCCHPQVGHRHITLQLGNFAGSVLAPWGKPVHGVQGREGSTSSNHAARVCNQVSRRVTGVPSRQQGASVPLSPARSLARARAGNNSAVSPSPGITSHYRQHSCTFFKHRWQCFPLMVWLI